MEINSAALELIKTIDLKGSNICNVLYDLKKTMQELNVSELEFTMAFDKNDQSVAGELLPVIKIGLYEKTEEE